MELAVLIVIVVVLLILMLTGIGEVTLPALIVNGVVGLILIFLRACLVNNRVGLGGAKSASFTPRTASCELFLQGSSSVSEAFLPKKAIERGPPRTLEPEKSLTLTFTKQALTNLVISPPIPINIITILISALGGVVGWLIILILHILGVAFV